MAEEITAEVLTQIAHNLADFGYEGMTLEVVQAEIDKISEGKEPDNIVGKFVHGMLVKNGYIEE